ncbi:MAG: GNAT family N-acetyltransferase [Myxococcaceae bacterium]
MEVEPAEAEDLEALYVLHTEAQGASPREHFFRDWERNLTGVRVVREEGRIIAAYRLDRAAEKVNLVSIDVAPEHQGQGLGTCLLQKILSDAKDVGARVTLVVAKRSPAQRLYLRLGFTQERESETHTFMEHKPQQET